MTKNVKSTRPQAKEDYNMTIDALGEVISGDEVTKAYHLYPPLVHSIEEYIPGIDIDSIKGEIEIATLDIIRYGKKHKQQAESYMISRITKLITELMKSSSVQLDWQINYCLPSIINSLKSEV